MFQMQWPNCPLRVYRFARSPSNVHITCSSPCVVCPYIERQRALGHTRPVVRTVQVVFALGMMGCGAGETGGDPSSGDGGDADRTVDLPRSGPIVTYEPGIDPELANRAANEVPQAVDDPALRPEIVYPYDHTAMPPNLYLVEWQWHPVGGADLYVTTFEGRLTTVHHVSTSSSFILDPVTWRALANGNLATPMTVTVRAASRDNLARAGAASIEIRIGPSELLGGLYYFSTTEGETQQGIFRYDFGVPVATATSFLTQQAAGECVGCHAVSRDGSRMGVTFLGGYGNLATLDVSNPGQYLIGGPAGPQRGGFVQFFDDDRGLLAVYDNQPDDAADPLNGQIRVYDTATGAADDTRLVPLTAGRRGSHVAVAPDGLTVAFVEYTDVSHRPIFEEEGAIMMSLYRPNTRSWDTPRTLVPFDGTYNNYYPSFSPDGQWLLFNRAQSGRAYDNPAASIWVIRADGSGDPIELVSANRLEGVTNSWPRWAPFVQESEFGNQQMWFAFSSKRDYGLRLVGEERAQLWMASFEPATALSGGDGSAPAFWLPFQNIETQNHTPTWTERVAPRECMTDNDCADPALRCEPSSYECVPVDILL